MSWFKRKPRIKAQLKQKPAHHYSPMAEKLLKETRDKVKSEDIPKNTK